MRALEMVFAVGWVLFWVYWLAKAFTMKRGRVLWSRELGIRVVMIVIIVTLVHRGVVRGHALDTSPLRATVGRVLFVLGLSLAVWARVSIGRNWGTPMTQKLEPELVTNGAYRYVRHPIYSGILCAGVGTAIALSWWWLGFVALAGVYFTYSATVEERFLTEQFPVAYPQYRRTTKMLIPFVL